MHTKVRLWARDWYLCLDRWSELTRLSCGCCVPLSFLLRLQGKEVLTLALENQIVFLLLSDHILYLLLVLEHCVHGLHVNYFERPAEVLADGWSSATKLLLQFSPSGLSLPIVCTCLSIASRRRSVLTFVLIIVS